MSQNEILINETLLFVHSLCFYAVEENRGGWLSSGGDERVFLCVGGVTLRWLWV